MPVALPGFAAVWVGRPPSPELDAACGAVGVRLLRASAPGAAAVVLADGAERFSRALALGLPWLWLRPTTAAAASAPLAAAAGAYDVLDRSASPAVIAERLAARLEELAIPALTPGAAPQLVAGSPAGRRLLAELAHAARTSMPVLLTGETGTGKEVAARLLHEWSARTAKRFVPINCAAIPNDLLESELFGYAKGAFSGAVREYDGELAAAEGGSVFLDEVDDTPLSFQVKLLRVLEDRVVSRLGDNKWRKVDFRILAATNRDLRALVAQGAFGPDLYERLAIVSIRLPPLRERREDLPELARHMMARFYREEPAARQHHQVDEITSEALDVLATYDWPGNIRELRNVVYGALVRKRAGRALLVSDLPTRLLRGEPDAPARATDDRGDVRGAIEAGRFNLRAAVERLEREALEAALSLSAGNAAAAAGLLGEVGRGSAQDPGATVRAMMKRLGLAPTPPRPPARGRRARAPRP